MLSMKVELISPQQAFRGGDNFCLGHIQFEVLKVEKTYRQWSSECHGEGLALNRHLR